MASSSSSSTSSSRRMRYQVFLSFRGADTRHNFTSNLLEALKKAGVNVFFDEEKLKKGEDVAPALSTAIAATKISVIILSEDYASSNSCLDELCDIMNLRKTKGHIVRPIFYHVDPSDVENVDGSFKTSFQNHEKRPAEQVEQWKTAFIEVGKLGGCVIKGGQDDRPETEYISNIVDSVKFVLTKHQIFLSFGETTRLNFTNYLHKALEHRGLNVVVSNGTLEEKSQAIANSDISIIILSDDYASSESCLAEVSEIMKHRETRKQIVLPIFYQVNPSVVRRNIPVFGEAGNIKGWHIKGENCDRSEIEYIEDVVEDVIEKMERKSRRVSKLLFGIYDQKEEILDLIKQHKKRVIIGLWGPGGIGKTTLAEAVYNELFPKFYSVCFLGKVSEKIKKEGIEPLRDQLLSKLLKSKIHTDTPSVACPLTMDRLENTKALVVLDDVTAVEQIADLGIEYLGDESKIIITSRERQVLENAEADEIHEVEGLSGNNSFQLFSAFAFKQLEPTPEFLTLSSKFLIYAQGNPLALKVLGSLLYKKSIEVWKSEAAKLGEYIKPQILEVLERSYRGLDELDNNIFLDIAIFFKGNCPKEDVEAFLYSCYGEGYLCGISNLVDKCLLEIITIYHHGLPCPGFSMHDMLEELGKHIESKDYYGNRRRLRRPDDVNGLLKYNQGANSIEGITSRIFDHRVLCQTVFQNMSNLRFIHIFADKDGMTAKAVDIDVLPDKLRYLEWTYYPFESLSSTFNPVNLVVLKLSQGKMKRLWNGDPVPLNLRELDVLASGELEEIPNLSGATELKILDCTWCCRLVKLAGLENLASLEKLHFEFCNNLVKIPSLSGATKLKILDCCFCTSLVELPSLSHLTSLEKLVLYGCKSLKKFPNLPNNFSELDLSKTGIEEVPASIENLIGLKSLKMSRSKVKKVSRNILKLESLQVLRIDFCYDLEILPQLPPNLVQLDAHDCNSLTEVLFTEEDPNLQLDPLRDTDKIFYIFSECSLLKPESVNNIVEYVIHNIRYLAMGSLRGLYPRSKELICCLPEKEISVNKFDFQSEGSWLTFEIDKTVCSPCEILAFSICLVVDLTCLSLSKDHRIVCQYRLTEAAGRDECGCHTYCLDNMLGPMRFFTRDHMLILFSDKLIFKGEYKKASFTFHINFTKPNEEFESSSMMVKKCGVQVFPLDLREFQCSDETFA